MPKSDWHDDLHAHEALSPLLIGIKSLDQLVDPIKFKSDLNSSEDEKSVLIQTPRRLIYINP